MAAAPTDEATGPFGPTEISRFLSWPLRICCVSEGVVLQTHVVHEAVDDDLLHRSARSEAMVTHGNAGLLFSSGRLGRRSALGLDGGRSSLGHGDSRSGRRRESSACNGWTVSTEERMRTHTR